MADKYNIPKGKMPSNCRLLPDHIVCKITQRNNMRRANTWDPAAKLLNEKMTSNIHKDNLWMEHLNAHWDHRHNTHTLWEDHTRSIQQSASTHTHLHSIQQQYNNHAQKYLDTQTCNTSDKQNH